jgi:tetratricopeptide (TPR) repeat protein
MTATSNRQSARSRALALAGLTLVALGGAATESIVPALAVGTGIALHTLMDFRRRARFLAVALGLFLLASTFSGTGRRAWAKLKELQAGQIAAAMTQRDIGVLAALEMVQRHPVLGVGPGCFENAFVPARLAAEARRERHMVHLSNSAHFENAHIEPLTIAAECGLPAALVCLSLTLGVLAALFLRQRREHEAEDGQERMTETLLVLLAASLVLSLGGFPLRFAATAAPIAFVAGLAFHRIGVIGVNGGSPRQAASLPPRTHLLVFVVLLSSLAALRCVAWLTQARAEAELHAAGMSQGAQRDRFLSRARHSLETSVQARPRKASAWLALGSVARLEGSREESLRHTLHSLWLEERAETDFNLGLLSLEMGRTDEARALFVRAVWILPRLLNAIPEGGDPGLVEMELREAEARISDGASAPKLPSSTPSPEF